MPVLPNLGETEDTEDWNSAQIWSFTICTYLITLMYVVVTIVALQNFIQFVVRGGNCKVEHPLFLFYIMVMMTFMTDAIYTVMIVKMYETWMPFVLYMPPTFKLLAGV